MTKSAEAFVLAANYLQTIPGKDPMVLQNIVRFYTKAKAFGQLAGFYESCAQTEIDDYQNYAKVLNANLGLVSVQRS